MKKLCVLISFLAFSLINNLSAQDSLDMTVRYNYNATGHTYNDCWGYVDGDGNEYAIVGTRLKIYFYNITDPDNVILVDEFSNNNPPELSMTSTVWRDFKTYGTKAYACADQSNNTEGLLVFDLSGLPDAVTLEEQNTSFFLRSHNIFIDTTSGYLYTAGANTRSDGTKILDLNADPITQVASVALDGGYIHDLYVNNDTAYCNSGYDGLYVIDFTDPESPATLGSIDDYTGNGYNHSCWPTESGDFLVLCDENVGRKVKLFDVSDYSDIFLNDDFHSNSPIGSSIAHNPFVKDELAYVAYYHDGIYVFDVSDPDNVTTHAYYDTNPQNNNGVWGIYPYFPSGNIIATDMDNGFYVMELLDGPLPVELIHFSAKTDNDRVKLEWTTASEKDSKLFEVQKSTNGVDFETILRVEAAGDSDIKMDYLTYDEKPFLGDNYYRLKQVDLDGKFEYFDIKVVRFSTSPIDIFPTLITSDNPLKILFSDNTEELQIQVFSIHGQLMHSVLLSGQNSQQEKLWLDGLQNGTYVVQALNNSYQVSKKIVIAR